MTDKSDDRWSRRTNAVVIVVHLLALMAIWVLIRLIAGDVVGWYEAGGTSMHVLLGIALAQTAVGALLGLKQLERPLPTSLHFALPIAAVLVGVGSRALGVDSAFVEMEAAPPELRLQLLAAALAIHEIPQQLGLIIAGCGCVPIVVVGSIAAFKNRERGRPDVRVGPSALVVVAGLVGSAISLGIFLTGQPQNTEIGLLLWLASFVVVPAILLGLATHGVSTLVTRDTPAARGVGFALAFMVGLAAIGSIVLQGTAIIAHGRIEVFQALAMAPPDMVTMLIAGGAATAKIGGQMSLAFGAAITAVVLLMLWPARFGLRPWLKDHWVWGLLTVAMVATATVAYAHFDAALQARVTRTVHRLRPIAPEGLALPGSSTESPFVEGVSEIVILRGGEAGLSPELLEPIRGAGVIDRIVDHLQRRPQSRSKVEGLVQHMADKSALPCPSPMLQTYSLVADGTASAKEILSFAEALRAHGGCRMHLLVESREVVESPDLAAQRDSLWREVEGTGMLAALFAAATRDWRQIPLTVTARLPKPGEATPVTVILSAKNEAIKITVPGTPDSVVSPTRRGRVDRTVLEQELNNLAQAFPGQHSFFLQHRGDASLQDLVDVLDAARGALDRPVLVTNGLTAPAE
ncbi:hypothetical protein ACFL6C_13325 [Myxococcota bacterium]